ncbi:pilus assembly protein TadG-related protein [Bradyrhizobium sp. CER78]|uniref:TadE/TadG family type IV pilus assembly protein n=1 Tax=Bradyrhizobium sp. CER78 TaxID=3039162 RepID=UPI00244A685A|nr:pilus assembly protein TadG-related protein [Bradyrhizobium sp. CER78]MDH2386673.1 pilus assembly protein TadG-related protein [Bradyrhizobium sp. CER78]
MRSAPDECRVRQDGLLKRFARDRSGSYAIIIALLMPVLVGTAGLGTEVAWWFYKHKNMMSAADSAAVSAATAGTNFATEANAVTTFYGYANGIGNVTVTVNQPPSTGSFASSPQAVEVIISQPQARLMSALFGSGAVQVTARAVALGNVGTGCVLALDPTANPSVTVKGNTQLNLINCNLYDNSNGSSALNVSGTATISAAMVGVVGGVSGTSSITATNGIRTGIRAIGDPYANVTPTMPTWCDYSNKFNVKGTTTLSPGSYCGDISVAAGATLTFNPGIYYFNGANLSVAGNATISGTGVTLVFTGSSGNWGTATIGSNANVSLTAPTSGTTAGIAIYGDRRMPVGSSFNLTGGGTQNLQGAVYLPKGALSFSGGNGTSANCTQIIADTISIVGNSNVKVNCAAMGGNAIGTATAQLVE